MALSYQTRAISGMLFKPKLHEILFFTKAINEKITCEFQSKIFDKVELFDCEINVATECMIQWLSFLFPSAEKLLQLNSQSHDQTASQKYFLNENF